MLTMVRSRAQGVRSRGFRGRACCSSGLYYTSCRGLLHLVQGFTTPPAGVYCTSCRGLLHLVQGFTTPRSGLYYTSCRALLHLVQGFTTPRAGLHYTSCRALLHLVLSPVESQPARRLMLAAWLPG